MPDAPDEERPERPFAEVLQSLRVRAAYAKGEGGPPPKFRTPEEAIEAVAALGAGKPDLPPPCTYCGAVPYWSKTGRLELDCNLSVPHTDAPLSAKTTTKADGEEDRPRRVRLFGEDDED